MKKCYALIITFTIAMLLVASIVFAADKKKKTKPAVRERNEISEEALKTELLATVDDHHKQETDTDVSGSIKNVGRKTKQENPPVSTPLR